MQKDITNLQLRLVAATAGRAADTVVVNLCSLWMSSEAFTGDRRKLPPLPAHCVELKFRWLFCVHASNVQIF